MEVWLDRERDQLMLWMPVALGLGIGAWFALPHRAQWIGFILLMLSVAAITAPAILRRRLARALFGFALLAAIGCGLIWIRAELTGVQPPPRTQVERFRARVERVELLPARNASRLTVAPDNRTDLPAKIRITMAGEADLLAARCCRGSQDAAAAARSSGFARRI
jgi:competence protein ComEC